MNHYFYYDTSGTYVNNSCFIIENGDKFLSVFLNSKIFRFFKKLNFVAYGDANSKGRNKLDANKMNLVPVPNVANKNKFEEIADSMFSLYEDVNKKRNRFIKRINSSFEIDKLSKKLLSFYSYNFKSFLLELKKKKVTLNLSQQDEWEEYFEDYTNEIKIIQNRIKELYINIDQMFYELYGLTEEEIAIVEAATK